MPVIAIGLPSSSSNRGLDQIYGSDTFPSPIPEANETAPTVDVDMGNDQAENRAGVQGAPRDGSRENGDGDEDRPINADATATGNPSRERQHINNHSIDSGIAFNRSPVQIKTVPLPTAPLPIIDGASSPLASATPTASSSKYPWDPTSQPEHSHSNAQAQAGPGPGTSSSAPDPSSSTFNVHSAVPPPAQPRRHRSGVLMSQARSRSRAHSGGSTGKGFQSSKSFGDLNLMGLQMTMGAMEREESMDGSEASRERDDYGSGGSQRRIISEGSRRTSVVDEGQMWDNSARFYHHLQSRPQSRQTSPDRQNQHSSRSGDVSPTPSSQASPIYVRRSATLPHHGAGPAAPLSQSHPHMHMHMQNGPASAALSPNQAFLHSHLPPIFNPSPGSSPENGPGGGHLHPGGGMSMGMGGNMVILTPTTAEWKELKKELGDMEGVGSESEGRSSEGSGSGSGSEGSEGSGMQDGSGASDGSASPGSMDGDEYAASQVGQALPLLETGGSGQTKGLMLDHGQNGKPEVRASTLDKPRLRPTLSADYLPEETTHAPDPGASPPDAVPKLRDTTRIPADSRSKQQSHLGDMPKFMQKVIAPSPILPSTPSMNDTPPISPQIVHPDGSDGQIGRSGEETTGMAEVNEDEPLNDEAVTVERFSSVGRRDSLRAVSKVRLPRTKTRRELERERLFKDLDEELEKDQDSPKAFEPVIAIGNGLGLVRDSSAPSSAPVPITQGGSPASSSTITGTAASAAATTAHLASFTGAAPVGASEGYFTIGARIEGSLGVSMPAGRHSPGPGQASRSQTDPSPATAAAVRTSPTQPMKPSPLHASPITAMSTISSPTDSPGISMAPPSAPVTQHRKRTTSRPHSRAHTRSASSVAHHGHTHGAANEDNLETIRTFARSIDHPHSPRIEITNPLASPPPISMESGGNSPKGVSPPERRRRDTKRVSLVAGRVVQPFMIPPSTALPPDRSGSHPGLASPGSKKASLNSFSPFRTPVVTPSTSGNISTTPASLGPGTLQGLSGLSGAGASVLGAKPGFPRFDSTISVAASTAPPSEPGTPGSETAGGLGGRGIEDYCILSEAGKGAYGLVMRAKVKGRDGQPVGEEVIIKYIVKARILADCWKKHKLLGPIPVEIFVMDQLRHLLYHTPTKPQPWDPARPRTSGADFGIAARQINDEIASRTTTPPPSSPGRPVLTPLQRQSSNTPDSMRSGHSQSFVGSAAKYLQGELKISPERGHPNICKLLDFFEDREFYYMVMPRFGSGLDLFDRVEACPDGLSSFEIRSLIGQLADAVRFLHSNGIVHRDIKDENVILDGEGRCQLIDFGSAAQWRPGKRWDTFSGTLHYASPEILRGELYSGKEQDVYALGTVMYVLLVGETPFGQLPDEVLVGLKEDTKAMSALRERCSPERQAMEDAETQEMDGGGRLEDALDLVQRCLEMEAPDRPPADVLVQHRFVRGEGGWTGHRGWLMKK